MYLKLTNVRQHRELELTLPDDGVVMLSGKSGAGKTTIFDAIEDALFGNGSGLKSWNGGSPEIILELNKPSYLRITRRRNPGYLEVKDGSGTYLDKEAQACILSFLGMSPEEFESCCYIRQEGAGSLLTLPPAEQLRFINKLSCGEVDPEAVKLAISQYIKQASAEIEKNTDRIGELRQKRISLESRIASIDLGQEVASVPFPSDDLSEMTANLERQEKVVAECRQDADNKRQLITRIESAKTRRTELEYSIQTTKQKIAEMPAIAPTKDIKALEGNLALLKRYASRLQVVAKMNALAAEIKTINTDAPDKNILQFIESELLEATESKELAGQQFHAAAQELARVSGSPVSEKCPHCEEPVFVSSGKLSKSDMSASDRQAKINENEALVSNLRARLVRVSDRVKLIDSYRTRAIALKAEFSSIDKTGFESLAEIQTLDVAKRMIGIIEADISSATEENKKSESLTKARDALETTLKTLIGEQDKLKDLPEAPDLGAAVSRLDSEAEKARGIQVAIETLRRQLHEFQMFEKSVEIRRIKEQQISEMKSDIKKIDLDTAEYNEKSTASLDRLASAKRLRDLVEFSAMAAIESMIDQINSNSAVFVNRMFEDDGTQITILNNKKTQKGDDRAKLSLDISHKGAKADKLSSLSGGEKARARLAFQLGLSMLYRAPILLADEGFAGLDEENKTKCLEVLREAASDRLILVIEHGAPESFFDIVVGV